MQRTPRPARKGSKSRRDLGAPPPRNTKVANGAILGMSALLVAGLGYTYLDSRVGADASAAPAYTTPPVESLQEQWKTALFLGDSYTAGVGVTSTSERWTRLLSNRVGWHEKNVGAGSTGYLSSMKMPGAQQACRRDYCPTYPEALEGYDGPEPDVVVVAGGRNDLNKSLDEFRAAVADTLDDVEERYPDAQVYVVSPVWDDEPAPAKLGEMTTIVRDTAKAADVTFLDVGQPLEGKSDLLAEDGVHPNTAGHAALADAFADALDEAS